MYCHAHLSGWGWLNLIMKGTLDLWCAARRGSEERSNSKQGGKLTPSIDFAKVSSRRNIIDFTVLFYRKFKYDSRGPGHVVWARKAGK